MSVIHKALKKANQSTRSTHHEGYNPLAQNRPQASSNSRYLLLAALLLIGTAAVMFWPISEPSPTSLSPQTTASVSPTQAPQNTQDAEVRNTAGNTAADLPPQISPSKDEDPITVTVNEPAFALPEESGDTAVVTPEEVPASLDTIEEPEAKQTVAKTVESVPVITASANKQPQVSASTKNTTTNETKTDTIIQSQQIWQNQVDAHIKNGEIEQAEAVLKQWIGASTNDITPKLWLARIYVNNRFYLAAEPLVSNIDTTDAKGLLGLIYERTNRAELASTTFEGLYRANPKNGRWLLFWALNSENSGQIAKSAILYQNYLQQFAQDDANLAAFAENRLRIVEGQ